MDKFVEDAERSTVKAEEGDDVVHSPDRTRIEALREEARLLAESRIPVRGEAHAATLLALVEAVEAARRYFGQTYIEAPYENVKALEAALARFDFGEET